MTRAGALVRPLMLALLALAVVAPLALLVLTSFGEQWFFPSLWPAHLTLDGWRAVGGGRRTLARAAFTSALLASLTGVLATAVAFTLGRALATLTGWRRRLGTAMVFLPVAAPPIAFGVGVQYSLLVAGLGGSFAGVLVAHLVPAVGFLSLYFLGVFSAFDLRIEDEARSLGATPRQTLWRITLPMLRRQVAEAIVLGALISWSQVALTQLIGGGLVRTLPLEVFAYVRSGQDRYAATGALLLIIPALAALASMRVAARQAEVTPL